MPAAPSVRELMLASSAASFAVVFFAFVLYEQPGLGIGHFFYLPIALAAMATGPRLGASAGVAAAGFYAAGMLVNSDIPSTDVLTGSTLIRLVTFVSIGALIGLFASRNRAMVDELRILAERDVLTGLPNTRAFEAAITRWLEIGRASCRERV
jgi:predicted signal transduction protein with EAL and GGDEF domain